MTGPHAGEAAAVQRTTGPPATRDSLAADLLALGVRHGCTVLVHSSMSALGWVVGGSEAVVLALESAVGLEGTLMMPAYSQSAPEPALWKDPAVPPTWWETIREEWPPFDPDLSPSIRLGTIAETFRHQRGTLRSFHPNHSFCARGPNAPKLVEGHSLDNSMGEESPLARLYDLGGSVLLLGVDHSSNSSFHLAEYRARWPSKRAGRPVTARFVRDGGVVQLAIHDLDLNSDDFADLGHDLERTTSVVRRGRVGAGEARLMDQHAAVDFAVSWIEHHRA